MGCLGATDGRFLVNEDLRSGRSKRGTVEVKEAMYMGICRELGMEATGAQ
jgi:hypothetical protein